MLPFDGWINVHPCQVKSAGKNRKTFEVHMRYSKSLSPSGWTIQLWLILYVRYLIMNRAPKYRTSGTTANFNMAIFLWRLIILLQFHL